MKKLTMTNFVHPETLRQAIAIAGNDLGRLDGWLNFSRLNYPGRSAQWYWDKILYDLERDRN
jgi:hypothetical protein